MCKSAWVAFEHKRYDRAIGEHVAALYQLVSGVPTLVVGAVSIALALWGCVSAWACSLLLGPSCDLTEEGVCPDYFMKAHEPKTFE